MRPPAGLAAIDFSLVNGFEADDLDAALAAFRRSAAMLLSGAPAQRPACAPPQPLLTAARAALESDDGADFFRRWFCPHRLPQPGFVTAYYEVEVEARLAPQPDFATPVLARPDDLVTLNDAPLPGGETSARRRPDGTLEAYPDRAAIEAGAAAGAAPIAYVRDAVELFLIQVQGSARLRLPDGRRLALTYDGRNGHPYTSVGKLLIDRGRVPAPEMSLARLRAELRAMGAGPGEAGRLLMQENRSYVFFRIDDSQARAAGPIGGAGCALTPLRSIAIDRTIWCYGLPFWVATRVPWAGEAGTPLERLMIAQDTGSAILGPARADLFFGAGEEAGLRAGRVRHPAQMTVLLPKAPPA